MHRLRDLDRGQRLVATGLVLLLLVPFGASVARAIHQQWLPSGDDALIGLRSLDVFTRHLPLVGQPSTTHLYGNKVPTSHPGPIEFYWLAVPMRLFGPSAGMIIGAGLSNLAGVLVAAWVVFRRSGPAVGAWALVVLAGVLFAEGTAVLTDVISSNAGGIPLLALAALAWAVADGDHRLLPLTALFGSWVAQQHLAIVVPAAAMVALAVAGAAVHGGLRWRSARVDASVVGAGAPDEVDGEPEDDGGGAVDGATPSRPARSWPWAAAALGVSIVCWLPVAWQQLTGHPGNITAVMKYAGSSHEAKLGAAGGIRQAVRALGAPPLLLRHDLTGRDFFAGPLHPAETVFALVGYLVLVATVVVAWRRRRALALLAGTALVLAAAGAYNGTTIPDSIEAFRINFYRWDFVVAWLAWITFGWLAVLAVGRLRAAPVPRSLVRVAPAAAALVMLVPAIASVATAGHDDQRRDQAGFRIMRTAADAAVAEAKGKGRVTLVLRGQSAALASGPALTVALTAAGHDVRLPNVESRFYGDHRVLHPGQDPGDLILELITGRGGVPAGPGRVLVHASLNPALDAALAPLAAQVRSTLPTPGPDADRLLRAHYDTPDARKYVSQLLARIGADPQGVLSDPTLLQLVQDGYFAAPRFDPRALAEVRRHLPARTVNNDDVFEVRVLTRAELAEEVPTWATT